MKLAESLAFLALIAIIGSGIYYFAIRTPAEPIPQAEQSAQRHTDASTLKTYTESETSFSIKYPAQYSVEASELPPDTQWGSRTLLVISNTKPQSSRPHAVPVQVRLQKQPVGADRTIYHTILDYKNSGAAAKMVQGATNPQGDLVIINDMEALLYHFSPSELTGLAGDSYFFIRNDLIYEIGFDPNDPYKDLMLQSISWK